MIPPHKYQFICKFKTKNKAEFNINPKKIDKDNISCKFCKFKDICFMEDYDTIKIEKRCNDDTEEAD